MFERFTDRARSVVVLAQEEARMLRHNYIGTEHVLLALVNEGEGIAAKALGSLDISLEAVRREVEEVVGRGEYVPTGHVPFTPRAKKVLELAMRESLQLGHNFLGTEHILLGLIREGKGVGAEVLQKMGADLDRVRQTVIQLLSATPGEAEQSGGSREGRPERSWKPKTEPTCPWCSIPLTGELAYRTLTAEPVDEEQGEPMSLWIMFCKACGGIVRTSLD